MRVGTLLKQFRVIEKEENGGEGGALGYASLNWEGLGFLPIKCQGGPPVSHEGKDPVIDGPGKSPLVKGPGKPLLEHSVKCP